MYVVKAAKMYIRTFNIDEIDYWKLKLLLLIFQMTIMFFRLCKTAKTAVV